MTQEKSDFLIAQEKRMKAYAEQDPSIEERAKYTIPAGSKEPEQPKGAYQVESFDATNNKVVRRTITPLPAPPHRFAKPEVPSLEQLRQSIDELTDDITAATADFDTVNANLDEYYAPLKAAEKRVNELRTALADAEVSLTELRKQGSPRDGFFSFINECEGKVSAITRNLLDRFCQDAAINTFKVAFSRLTEHTQKDLSLVYRIRLERFREGVYARLRRQEQATGDQIKGRASELLRDLATITKENFDK
jgi:hypothetical protein